MKKAFRWLQTGEPTPPVVVALVCGVASAVILAAKFVLVSRININWDEFYFLTHVHALARGDLDLFLQGAYTHVFRWITNVDGDEVEQIVMLRLVMCVLLSASALLVYALARLWVSRPAALVAVLAFLSTWPVVKHGASFRADALILPLTLGGFWLALREPKGSSWHAATAGACLGLAIVVTAKAVLLLPALVLMAMLPDAVRDRPVSQSFRARLRVIVQLLVLAGIVAAALLMWHRTQLVAPVEPAGRFAANALESAILGMPFAPRRDYFVTLAGYDPIYWTALLAGFVVAVRNRQWSAAASLLALAPVLFYRNAYPYYYPVMLAPATVLIAILADRLLGTSSAFWRKPAVAVLALACLAWLVGARDAVLTLRFDRQADQRAIVAAVHQVFPEPVPYVDHSGMIATFPKVNFFMSNWGVENYLRRGRSFMPAALADRCPPLVLVNHPALTRGTVLYRRLTAIDRDLLETRYVDYWGPIRVAGAQAELVYGKATTVRVPCSGRYRIESEIPLRLDGLLKAGGEIVDLRRTRAFRIEPLERATSPARVRLVWADAEPPPAELPPGPTLYDPL